MEQIGQARYRGELLRFEILDLSQTPAEAALKGRYDRDRFW